MAESSLTSVIIPAHKEPHLSRCVDDVFAKASGAIEVIVVLDGYWPDPQLQERDGLIIIHHGQRRGMRASINAGAGASTGKYLLKCDAHCAFMPKFNAILSRDCEPDWVLVPRRYKLNVDDWTPDPTRRYEFQYIENGTLKGRNWPEYAARVSESDRLVDLMTTQGSCWFMHKSMFIEQMGGLDENNYGGMGREAQEVCLKAWLSGGRMVLDRNVWYAHWNKPRQYVVGDREGKRKSVSFATDFWMNNRWESAKRDMDWLISRFSPVPSWNGDGANSIRAAKKPKEEQRRPIPVQGKEGMRPYLASRFGIDVTDDMQSPITVAGMNRRMMYEMFATLGLKRGCEVGVQRGRNAKMMVDSIPGLYLHLVDPYEDCDWGNRKYNEKHHAKMRGMTLKRFKDNDRVKLLQMYSIDAVGKFEDGELDFVYIDGMHTYDFVMQDQIIWTRKVRAGGIISGHDYVSRGDTIGVMHAVDDYTRRHGIWPVYITDAKAYETKGDKCPSWFYVNPSKDEIVGRVKLCARA